MYKQYVNNQNLNYFIIFRCVPLIIYQMRKEVFNKYSRKKNKFWPIN